MQNNLTRLKNEIIKETSHNLRTKTSTPEVDAPEYLHENLWRRITTNYNINPKKEINILSLIKALENQIKLYNNYDDRDLQSIFTYHSQLLKKVNKKELKTFYETITEGKQKNPEIEERIESLEDHSKTIEFLNKNFHKFNYVHPKEFKDHLSFIQLIIQHRILKQIEKENPEISLKQTYHKINKALSIEPELLEKIINIIKTEKQLKDEKKHMLN